jgi:hypothetical protein
MLQAVVRLKTSITFENLLLSAVVAYSTCSQHNIINLQNDRAYLSVRDHGSPNTNTIVFDFPCFGYNQLLKVQSAASFNDPTTGV